MNYAIEVRAAEDSRLLGHVNCPVPSSKLPAYWTFALRSPMQGLTQLSTLTKVSLTVAEFREGRVRWRAFSVPAKQWEEIKDLV